MTTEEQTALRILIAEDQGFCFMRSEQSGGVEEWHDCDGEVFHSIPNYTTSLDAVWQAVNSKNKLFKQRFQGRMFVLMHVRNLDFLCELRALDWAICYKETLEELKQYGP